MENTFSYVMQYINSIQTCLGIVLHLMVVYIKSHLEKGTTDENVNHYDSRKS